ncbi:EAL domain-containing protein [Cupriavidus basilensis]
MQTPGAIFIMLQPQFRIGSGALAGAEALCRWRHPEQGLIRPDLFIPRLEALGEADAIFQLAGQQCLGGATAIAGARRAHPAQHQRIRPDTMPARRTGRLLRCHGGSQRHATPVVDHRTDRRLSGARHPCPVDRTEPPCACSATAWQSTISGSASRPSSSWPTCHSPRSSWTAPSWSLYRATASARRSAATCINLARDLKLECVAEGIETPVQRDALQALGCDLGQGYLWSPALPPDMFVAEALGRWTP